MIVYGLPVACLIWESFKTYNSRHIYIFQKQDLWLLKGTLRLKLNFLLGECFGTKIIFVDDNDFKDYIFLFLSLFFIFFKFFLRDRLIIKFSSILYNNYYRLTQKITKKIYYFHL